MCCLLCQPIKAVERATKNGDRDERKESKRAFFNTESTNLSAGAGGMSDYERIKTVVSGHQCVSDRVGQKSQMPGAAVKKAQPSKRRLVRDYSFTRFVFLTLLEDCSEQ